MARKKSSKHSVEPVEGEEQPLDASDASLANSESLTNAGGDGGELLQITDTAEAPPDESPEVEELPLEENEGEATEGDVALPEGEPIPDEQEPAPAAADGAAEPETPMPTLASNISDEDLAKVASALIFASTKPLSVSRLAELLVQSPGRIRAALAALDEKLRGAGAPFKLVEIAGGFRYMTDESVAKFVFALRGEQKKERLSAAALETLAIIAYRQPVSKGEIEAMRGVQAGPMLRMLLDKRLIRITGRAAVPGRPLQYGTTKEFLDKFNLASLKDLPTVEELAKP